MLAASSTGRGRHRELLPKSEPARPSILRTGMGATGSSERVSMTDRSDGRPSVLVIGTSPISLLIALVAGRDGYRVTVVERSERVGGAWAYDQIDGRLIDRACHLLEPLAPARRWIFEQLDMEPLAYSHPPLAVTPWRSTWPIESRRHRAFEWAMAWPAAARHLISAAGGDGTEFRRVVIECKHDIGRLTRRTAQELRSGPAPAMSFSPNGFARLSDLALRTVDDVRLTSDVARIDYMPDRAEFWALLDGVDMRFDHVVVPSGADVEVQISGRPVNRRRFRFENHHLLLAAEPGDRALSYVGFMADGKVRRVVDTGPIESGPLEPGRARRHRYLAHVRGDDVTVDDVVRLLAGHGFVDPAAPAELLRRHRFVSTRTLFQDPLPPGLWAPDTYGDLSDNLANLLRVEPDGEVRLPLPFAAVGAGRGRD